MDDQEDSHGQSHGADATNSSSLPTNPKVGGTQSECMIWPVIGKMTNAYVGPKL